MNMFTLQKQRILSLLIHKNQNSFSSTSAAKAAAATATHRFEAWMKMYEDFVGLTVVKQAQHKVIEVSINQGVNLSNEISHCFITGNLGNHFSIRYLFGFRFSHQ